MNLADALTKDNVVIAKILREVLASSYHTHADALYTTISNAASDAQPYDCLPEPVANEAEAGSSHHHANMSTIDDTEHTSMC